MKGRGRRGHTSAFGRRWACPESARDDYARVISDRKWPLKKRPVIAHIKARSKHSCLTINRNDKKKKSQLGLIKHVGVFLALCGVCACALNEHAPYKRGVVRPKMSFAKILNLQNGCLLPSDRSRTFTPIDTH